MSTEILSTSLGEALVLKDVIPMAQGLGAVALLERSNLERPTDWRRESQARNELAGLDKHLDDDEASSRSSVRITMGGDEVSGDVCVPALTDSVRPTASFEGDDWPDHPKPKRREDMGDDDLYIDNVRMGSEDGFDDEGYNPDHDNLRKDRDRPKSLVDSVRITVGGDIHNPFPNKKRGVPLGGTEEGDAHLDDEDEHSENDEASSRGSVRITMGSVNGDDTNGNRGPGSPDPFKKSEDERRGR